MGKAAKERELDYRISADIVVYLRKNRGLTLAEIGTLMGVDKTFISKVLHEECHLTLRRLMQLEKALDMPLPVLLVEAVQSYSIPEEEREALRHALQPLDQSKPNSMRNDV